MTLLLSIDWHHWLDTCLEVAVVYILIKEFNYDKALNEHVKSMKKRAKKRFEFEALNEGEGR